MSAPCRIEFDFCPTPFGECLLARTPRGICQLDFTDGNGEEARRRLAARWPEADLVRADLADLARDLFSTPGEAAPAMDLRGTDFQKTVWAALLGVPPGATVSYGELAARLGRPAAARAVASAVARNPVGYLVPCHRVLRAGGQLGGYRWGAPRKRALLEWESRPIC